MSHSADSAHPTAACAEPLRVLLLDDDAFMLALLAELIEELGQDEDQDQAQAQDQGRGQARYQVYAETSSRQALATLRERAPHLLICDLAMPDMDGIEFLRCAAWEQFRGSVVLLSGVDEGVLQAARRLALAQGITVLDACPKPLQRAQLAGLLERAAARRDVAV